MALLLNYYGKVLTEKQRRYLELYYDEDLSLGEIAELQGVSRPGAYDIINRSRNKLIELEKKTGIVARIMKTRFSIERSIEIAAETGAEKRLIDMLSEVADGI